MITSVLSGKVFQSTGICSACAVFPKIVSFLVMHCLLYFQLFFKKNLSTRNILSWPVLCSNTCLSIQMDARPYGLFSLLCLGAAFTRFQTLRFQKLFPNVLAEQLISYGSCQFPTLGFVVERFKAIQAFVPELFYKIKGMFQNIKCRKRNIFLKRFFFTIN